MCNDSIIAKVWKWSKFLRDSSKALYYELGVDHSTAYGTGQQLSSIIPRGL